MSVNLNKRRLDNFINRLELRIQQLERAVQQFAKDSLSADSISILSPSGNVIAHLSNANNPHATTLENLDDTDISSVGDNEVIAYNSGSSNYINKTAAEAGLATTAHSHGDSEVANDITLDNLSQITTKSHTVLSDVGSNLHSVIDTHLADGTKHFTMLDEDDLVTDSNTQAATQQSIKAYVDAVGDTDWDATTVSQAEAEAGTATTDRKWTAERVAQAIAALESGGGGASELDDLSDVTLTGLGDNEILQSASGTFINRTYAEVASNIEGAISHDNLNDFASGEHFTMLDEDDMSTDSNTQAATQQSIKAYVDATFTLWYYLDPKLFTNAVAVKEEPIKMPGNSQLAASEAVNNRYYYASTFISIPTGWKAKVIEYAGFANNGTNLYWKELKVRTITINTSTDVRTTAEILTVSNPFGTSSGTSSYNNASLSEKYFYTYDDDTSDVLSELTVRYQIEKGAASGTLTLWGHTVKIQYEKL